MTIQPVLTDTVHRRDVGGALDSDLIAVADAIVRAGLWCVLETRTTTSSWEPELLICRKDPASIAAAIATWRRRCPNAEGRIAGYTRDTLSRVNAAATASCGDLAGPSVLGAGSPAGVEY